MCDKVGWTSRTSQRGIMVSLPDGSDATLIPARMKAGPTARNVHSNLRKMGIDRALDEWEAKEKRDRGAKLDKDRRKAEEATRRAEEAARNVIPHIVKFEAPAASPATNGANKPIPTPAPSDPVDPDNWPKPGGPMETIDVLVTPEIALDWLTRPLARLEDGSTIEQRPRRETWVRQLTGEMRDGTFLKTPQGISLAAAEPVNTGAPVDGQHRLQAIVESEIPQDMRVTFNVPPELFPLFDIGKPRTGGDMLAMRGEKQVHHLASVLKLIAVWELWRLNPQKFPSWRNWSRVNVTNAEMVAVHKRWPNVGNEMRITKALIGSPLKYGNQPAFTLFRLWLREVWPEGCQPTSDGGLSYVDTWINDQVRLGLGIMEQDDPVGVLRNWINGGNASKIPGAVRELSLLALLRSWNAHVKKRKFAFIRVGKDDIMPVPVPGTQEMIDSMR
jgi:hypothetical protein